MLERGPRYAAAKAASLLRSRGPSNSDLLVRCCEGGLRSGEETVRLFVISAFVLFFCLLTALLIPTSPYSIEQYNMRD